MIDVDPDFVVAGAGHNSLITACYLAKAGNSVLVLDARAVPGGGCATEELLLPGYRIDSCATGHTLIQANPVLAKDELGLIRDFGLTYVEPDPVAHVVFPDGESITHWLDVDRTVEEFSRFSTDDAAAYRRLLTEWAGVKRIFGAERLRIAGTGPSADSLLEDHPMGQVWRRRRLLSAWDVIKHEFESRHVRAYLLWQAYQTGTSPDLPGSGLMAYSIVASRQERSWTIPVGGSGSLTGALVQRLERDGGRVVCNRRVTRLVLEDGVCRGVETEDGTVYRAGKGVVSSIHVKHLIEMAPADAWDDAWTYGVRTYDLGISGFGSYQVATQAPTFPTAHGDVTAVSSGTVGWPEDLLRYAHDTALGRWSDEIPWLLIATPSLVDPSRVPVEGHHTVKLLSMVGHELPDGDDWASATARRGEKLKRHVERVCPNYTADVVLAELVKGPYDYEAANPHMIRGTFHGGDAGPAFSGTQRPAPGWAGHRTPIAGLYQTGCTTHPGGSITGAPGRNAAGVVLGDLGSSLEEVVAAG